MWAINGLAIVIGGVGMMNSQLMSVMGTREISVLRAVGWSKRRVLWMILARSIAVSPRRLSG
jgi:putative ABC transport system permease protein